MSCRSPERDVSSANPIGGGGSEAGVRVTLEELIGLRRAVPRRSLSGAHPVRSLASGQSRSRERGRGIEFEEMRLYQPGDDIRAIDWRASARLGRPFTKLFGEERERSVFVAVDQRSGMFFGSRTTFKSVVAARTATLACWTALARGDPVGGLVAGERLVSVRAARERGAVLGLIDALTTANRALSAHAPAGVALERVLTDCLAHATDGSTIVLFSDFGDYESDLGTLLAALARRRRLVLVGIDDPLEARLDVTGRVGVSDGREHRAVWLTRRSRARYQAGRAARAARLARDASDCGATLRHLSTERAPTALDIEALLGGRGSLA